jgi:hypothetical protein
MELRREPRFEADQDVEITLLGTQESTFTARVVNASGRGLALEIDEPVPAGTALRIRFEDSVILAEAVYCRSGPGAYLIGVELDQMLCGLTELGKKLQEFAEGESGRQVAPVLNQRRRQDRRQSQDL